MRFVAYLLEDVVLGQKLEEFGGISVCSDSVGDRKIFVVHFEIVNLKNCPRREYKAQGEVEPR